MLTTVQRERGAAGAQEVGRVATVALRLQHPLEEMQGAAQVTAAGLGVGVRPDRRDRRFAAGARVHHEVRQEGADPLASPVGVIDAPPADLQVWCTEEADRPRLRGRGRHGAQQLRSGDGHRSPRVGRQGAQVPAAVIAEPVQQPGRQLPRRGPAGGGADDGQFGRVTQAGQHGGARRWPGDRGRRPQVALLGGREHPGDVQLAFPERAGRQ